MQQNNYVCLSYKTRHFTHIHTHTGIYTDNEKLTVESKILFLKGRKRTEQVKKPLFFNKNKQTPSLPKVPLRDRLLTSVRLLLLTQIQPVALRSLWGQENWGEGNNPYQTGCGGTRIVHLVSPPPSGLSFSRGEERREGGGAAGVEQDKNP